jgi:hypothetical protein
MSSCYCGRDDRCDVCQPIYDKIIDRVMEEAAKHLSEAHAGASVQKSTSGFVSVRVSDEDLGVIESQLFATCSDAALERWKQLRAELAWLRSRVYKVKP